jgi:hypothetical protein
VIYVLKGKAKVVTYNVEGEKEEVEVESGWAAGWPGGSSTCRSIVHNSAHEDEDLFLFVVTEVRPFSVNLLFYSDEFTPLE